MNLVWFDDGLNGNTLDMSDRTFHNGLKELIEKGFLKPKLPNQFWVNPALFFKGDRVAFMREYRIKDHSTKALDQENLTAIVHEE